MHLSALHRSCAVLGLAGIALLLHNVARACADTASVGQAVTFSVTADGSAPLSYQWFKDGARIGGATGASYVVASAQLGDAGTYYAVVSNPLGSVASDNATLVLTVSTAAPAFTTQPVSQTANAGAAATLTAVATGLPAPTFQWYRNGVAISGATSSAYTIASLAPADAGTYSVVATNSAGSVTSSGATLTVNAPPAFTIQPASQTSNAGTAVTFSAVATGSPAPTFQWRKNGVAISGATGSAYAITSLAPADAGTYSVVATNSVGSVASSDAVLTVAMPPAFTTQPISQAANAGTLVTFTAAATGLPAPTFQWRKNGVVISGATGPACTITGLSLADAGTYSVVATNGAGSATSSDALLTVTVPPAFTLQPASQTANAGIAVTFTAAAIGCPAPIFQWRKNGVAIGGATGSAFAIASPTPADAGTYSVVAANTAGSVASSDAVLTVNAAPVFTVQPLSQTANAGTVVTFTSVATGAPAPTFQWRKNGVAIVGATGPAYTIASLTAAAAGTYSVIATNSLGSATSSDAVLAVTVAPVFTTQPSSQTVNAGVTVTFSASATGTPAPTYQWYKNGVAIAGARSSSYKLTCVQRTAAGSYTVVATNSGGSVTSASAVLTVNVPPVITAQPAGQTAKPGANVTFKVTACGTPAPSYQWRKDGVAISGATGTSYPITGVTAASAGTYTVVVANPAGSVTSTGAVLTITAAPVFTTQPISQTVAPGATVTFTAVASGSPAPTYQWRKDGVNITGATAGSYVITGASPGAAGTYSVVATNSAGSVTSAGAALTVTTSPPTFTLQPVSWTVKTGATLTFTAAASGAPTPAYQWLKNGVNVAGATTASYTIAAVTAADAGTYSVVATNSAGSATSAGAVLRTVAPTAIVSADFNFDGHSDIVCQNRATGERAIWLMNGTSRTSTISLGIVSTDWSMVGTGDYDGDGNSDLFWQNTASGECAVWLMNGPGLASIESLGVVSADWQMAAVGDFNGDGRADIVWQNRVTGERFFWVTNPDLPPTVVSLGTVSTDQSIAGTGDFDGDGDPDILWENKVTGERTIWLMNGLTAGGTVSLGVVSKTTSLLGTGDFYGDGDPDILLEDSATGQGSIWRMNGTSRANGAVSLGAVGPDWWFRN